MNQNSSPPMNLQEQRLHYPFAEALPAPGQTLKVAPGIKWIRMSLPFVLNHINLWLLRDSQPTAAGERQGWTIVDCCISHENSRAQWEQIFASELEGLPVLRVIVTHMHPDHIGLAAWLCQRWDAPLWISATDYNAARIASVSTTGFGGNHAADFFALHGLTDPDAQLKIRGRSNYFPTLVPAVPSAFRRMMDGDVLSIGGKAWACISGHGHAPEHIALYNAKDRVLIGGDMMLPRISTNVSVYDIEPESNPLKQFLHSIEKFRALHPDTLTLPSHGKPFTGLYERIDQLQAHHRDRLAEVMEACAARPCSAADVLPVLFKRELDLHQTTFAMGEAVAHLHSLWFDAKLQRNLGADGVYRFVALQQPQPLDPGRERQLAEPVQA